MPDDSVEQVPDEVAVIPARRFAFVRVGTFMLTAPNRGAKIEKVLGALTAALAKDPRVPAKISDDASAGTSDSWERIFPKLSPAKRETVLGGSDALFAARFMWPLNFIVRVSPQHQPVHLDIADSPTDTYAVAWDGTSVVVAWEQDSPSPAVSAGHIALKVLEDAAVTAGYSVYSQGCSPGCKYMFMHTTMRLEGISGDRSAHWVTADDFQVVNLTLPDPYTDLESLAVDAWFELNSELSAFASFKNIGRRILDLEQICRIDLAHLLSHNYAHANSKLLRWRDKPKTLWSNRKWRNEARSLIASLWLSMANIESLTREWEDSRNNLVQASDDKLEVFALDYRDDRANIESLQLGRTADAVHQVVEVLDSRFISLATAFGAVGGGVLGSALTLLLH